MTKNLTDVERVIQQTTGYIPRLLFVISGPSGVGKNTIIKKILTNHDNEMARVRTYTTREPREDEVEGAQYFFVSREQFRELALDGALMEADAETAGHDVYGAGHLYSMPTDIYVGIPPEIHLVIAEVDIHGMYRLKARVPDCISVFVTAEPVALLERIRNRPDEHMDAENLNHRMETAREQIRAAKDFDYLVFNQHGQLDQTVAQIETIIQAERMRTRHGVDLEAIIPDEAFKTNNHS